MSRRFTRFGVVGVAASLAVIAFATLGSARPAAVPTPIFCLACGDLGGVDVILNVLLFIPLGVSLHAIGMTWRRAALVAFGTSLLVECLQYSVIPGRDASLSDLLTNSLGGAIGALAATHWRTLAAPSPRQAQAWSIASLVAAMAVLAATAALLRPSVPSMWLWGQWTPLRQQFEPYTGRVTRFAVNATPIPYGKILEWDVLRQSILRRDAVARVEFVSGKRPTRLAAIARLVGEGNEVFLLGARGDAVVFRARLKVRDWRLRAPFVALPGALGPPGENVTVEASLLRDGWRVSARTPRGEFVRHVPFSVALGWAFILPFEHPLAPVDRWLSALWLAVLVLPAAYWGASATTAGGRGRWLAGWGFPAALAGGGLVLIPAMAHFAPASPIEWLGLALGGVAGGVAASRLRRLATRDTTS